MCVEFHSVRGTHTFDADARRIARSGGTNDGSIGHQRCGRRWVNRNAVQFAPGPSSVLLGLQKTYAQCESRCFFAHPRSDARTRRQRVLRTKYLQRHRTLLANKNVRKGQQVRGTLDWLESTLLVEIGGVCEFGQSPRHRCGTCANIEHSGPQKGGSRRTNKWCMLTPETHILMGAGYPLQLWSDGDPGRCFWKMKNGRPLTQWGLSRDSCIQCVQCVCVFSV